MANASNATPTATRLASTFRPIALLMSISMFVLAGAGVASAHRTPPRHASRVVVRAASLPAGVVVCNEAQSSPRGTMDATASTDPLPPARHKSTAMPVGHGNGLINAAANSPALAICVPQTPPDDG